MGSTYNVEDAKRAAAAAAVKENFPENPRFVGIGSGTTIVFVVEAIKNLVVDVSRICFVPTGYQSRQLIINAGLIPLSFDALPDDVELDIAFDGADEVDDELNCIKGGGACLFQEKLVAMRARKFICVAGRRLCWDHEVGAHANSRRSPEVEEPALVQLANNSNRGRSYGRETSHGPAAEPWEPKAVRSRR